MKCDRFETAYIDGAVASGSTYRPRFVSNNYKKGKKVLAVDMDPQGNLTSGLV